MRFHHLHYYGSPLDERIDAFFLKFYEEMEYADNFRVAETSNDDEMGVYWQRYDSGCCGFHDEYWTDKETGREFAIGCNFGH